MSAQPDLSALRIDRGPVAGPSRRVWPWLMLVFIIVAVIAVWWFRADPAPTVQTASARAPVAAAMAVLNASGYVTPRRRATVAATITGRVIELNVEEGMPVKAGDILARLDDRTWQAQLAVAKAEQSVERQSLAEAVATRIDAERSFARVRKLREAEQSSQQEWERAETALTIAQTRESVGQQRVEAAQRRVEQAEQAVDDCIVRAPFAGIAVSKDAQVGEIVSPMSAGGGFTRTGISTIVDMASLEIEVDVNEDHIAKVTPGQPVEAVLDAHPEWKIPATVKAVIPTADRQKATVRVRIAINDLSDSRIIPDLGVKVAFQSAQPALIDTAIKALIPKDAVRLVDGATVVYLLRGDRAERRAVTIADAHGTGTDAQILAGVNPGDRVIITGPPTLIDGQRVREP